jgi:hypothetical protein
MFGSCGSVWGLVAGFSEHFVEPSISMKGEKFIDQLCDA